MRRVFIGIAMSIACLQPAFAQDRESLGTGRLFTNDNIGDGNDRWRSGSYVISHVRGRSAYDGTLGGFGDIIEYRLRSEIISATRNPAKPGDRPYVGALSFGAHTHFDWDGFDVSLGVDILAVGPQTGLASLQTEFHSAFGLQDPATDNPVANDVFLTSTAEVSRTLRVDNKTSIRPFLEAQFGAEDLVRFGADVLIGRVAQQDLMLRDVSTGHLYRATDFSDDFGTTFVFGADVAMVSGSVFLPESDGYIAEDRRFRVRAGVHQQFSDEMSFFYGATYLSEEFVGQSEGQILGSLKLNFNF